MLQGDIYLADLSPIQGHEQDGYRPVLIIQNDILNHNLSTVIILPLTSRLPPVERLTTYTLPSVMTSLSQDSSALLYQIRTVDKGRLKRKVGNIPPEHILEIKERLQTLF